MHLRGAAGRPVRTPQPQKGSLMSEREVDAELVARVQRGDKRAFDLLVLKYQRKIMRLLSRMIRDPAEVEDVAQEAFIKAYRALPQLRGERNSEERRAGKECDRRGSTWGQG